MSWWSYVARVSAPDDQKAIAKRAGIDQSSVSRWKIQDRPGRAESVAAFARAYNRPVLEAFVAAGFLTGDEAQERPGAAPDFTQLTNDELLELVRARMREDVMGNAEHPAATKAPESGPADQSDRFALAANEGEGDIEAEQEAVDTP